MASDTKAQQDVDTFRRLLLEQMNYREPEAVCGSCKHFSRTPKSPPRQGTCNPFGFLFRPTVNAYGCCGRWEKAE